MKPLMATVALALTLAPAAPSKPPAGGCPQAHKAVAYYRGQYNQHRHTLGQPGAPPLEHNMSCQRAKQRAHHWRTAARKAQAAADRFWNYHYNWRAWLPDKYARVGACETGYGRKPGNWHWDSGTYVSAFGIYRPAYAQFAHQLGLPTWDAPGARTPRQQFMVARAIQQRYGWGAWGCGGA